MKCPTFDELFSIARRIFEDKEPINAEVRSVLEHVEGCRTCMPVFKDHVDTFLLAATMPPPTADEISSLVERWKDWEGTDAPRVSAKDVGDSASSPVDDQRGLPERFLGPIISAPVAFKRVAFQFLGPEEEQARGELVIYKCPELKGYGFDPDCQLMWTPEKEHPEKLHALITFVPLEGADEDLVFEVSLSSDASGECLGTDSFSLFKLYAEFSEFDATDAKAVHLEFRPQHE